MNTIKKYLSSITVFSLIALFVLPSCKVGDEDPALSLKSRDNRITQFWTLNEVRENNSTVDQDGTLTWDINDDGNLVQKSEGNVFGVSTEDQETGSWYFSDDKANLVITLPSSGTQEYVIERLASKDLWLYYIDGSDTYSFEFEQR